jgi:hypothetical protein
MLLVYSLYEANAPLPTAANPKVRYQYADLVATFSRPITNPFFTLEDVVPA